MVEVTRTHRMRMELDAAEIDDPGEAGGIVDHHLLGGAARGERERHRAQPVGPLRRRPLLVEDLALGAVDEALQHHRTVTDAGDGAGRHREVVVDDVALGEMHVPREIRLLRMRDPHRPTVDLDRQLVIVAHGGRRYTILRRT